ncbi:MAG TPA: O-acetyl-ADP-ribose deacetylase [Candidatus Omnitrophota bacterium]|nr:O-acetyl-ADP-ribose deacetylase [Candidatus Omnitrophota bacterium]HQJ15032.1 O-acetyl-ADP-ribose deacetylase [Candidatus Omnitrophota bacterium]
MTTIECIQGDITKVRVDAIVNAANRSLSGGGGVDGAIHRAAGPRLLDECRTLGGCETGQAKITGGYGLPAKFVIHTVGPVWYGGSHDEEKLLADAYRNSLALAVSRGLKSIAFPAISAGAYRFPFEKAAGIALSTVKKFIESHPDSLERVVFVLFSRSDYDVYLRLRGELFPGLSPDPSGKD